jgi:hypothetical protein
MPDDNSELRSYLNAIDGHDDELASLRGTYMNACKSPHEAIREVLTSAREAGVNMKALRVLLKGHRNDRKQAARVAELETDDAAAHAEMIEALGEFADTPLGSAAVEGAKPRRRRGKEDGLDTLRP